LRLAAVSLLLAVFLFNTARRLLLATGRHPWRTAPRQVLKQFLWESKPRRIKL
jgi:hypothetical protein